MQLSLPVNNALEDLLINPKKLQHKISQECFKQMVSSIQENSQSCHESSRSRSLRGKGAGAWLDSIPTSTKFALNAANFCFATRLRLECDIPLAAALDSCECGQSLDSKGYHLLTCKHGGRPL